MLNDLRSITASEYYAHPDGIHVLRQVLATITDLSIGILTIVDVEKELVQASTASGGLLCRLVGSDWSILLTHSPGSSDESDSWGPIIDTQVVQDNVTILRHLLPSLNGYRFDFAKITGENRLVRRRFTTMPFGELWIHSRKRGPSETQIIIELRETGEVAELVLRDRQIDLRQMRKLARVPF